MVDGGGRSGLVVAWSAGVGAREVAGWGVTFAEWRQGNWLSIIIDRGDGLRSLYAKSEALVKKAGDAVHAGDAVSTVGSSGGQGRNALYFEMRQGGKPVDPRAWLRRR